MLVSPDGSAVARLPGLRVRIPQQKLMSVCCEFCVLSGRGLCVVSVVCFQAEVCVLLVLSGRGLCVVSVVCCQIEVCVLLVLCVVR
jgi:hypothetical protein